MSESDAERTIRDEAINEQRINDEAEYRTNRKFRRFLCATAVLGILFVAFAGAVIPFLKGHALYDSWESVGKYLLILAMLSWAAFLLSGGLTFGVWRYLRGMKEVHRKYAPPLSKKGTGSGGKA